MSEKNLKHCRRLIALFSACTITFTSVPVSAELIADESLFYEDPEYPAEEDSLLLSEDPAEELIMDGDLLPEEDDGSLTDYSDGIYEEITEDLYPGLTGDGTASSGDGISSVSDETLTDELLLSDESELIDTPDGIRYIKGRPLTDEERAEQMAMVGPLAPIPDMEIDEDEEELSDVYLARVGAVAAYDARSQGLVTSVKNQGSYLDCWAYALASQMETSVLNEGGGEMDLSEEHLAYFWCHRADDPLNNTPNDSNTMSQDFHSGGNTMLGAFHLSTWSGMAQDTAYPQGSGPFPASSAYDTAVRLEDAAFFSNSKSYGLSVRVNRIKNMILAYKSVSGLIAFAATASGNQGNYYNPDTAAFCNPNEGAVNHAIVIVGWDDSYSKDNFALASKVAGDGAWIVKNSWGPSWGDNGYFYISYEDMSLNTIVAASGTASPEYENNYFYDGTAGIETGYLQNGESIACIFKATAGNGKGETLGEIVTASGTDNATFSGQVYLGLTDLSDPTSGVKAYSSMTLTQKYLGMQTHKVAEVDIAPNTYYSVVLTNTSGKGIAYYFEKTRKYQWCLMNAGTEKNQGFYRTSGAWTDLYSQKISPRIKVHTRTENYVPSMTVDRTSVSLTPGNYFTIGVSTSPASCGSLGYGVKTSNKNVATVSGRKVTASGGGTCTITVWPLKAPNIKKTITVTVKPKAPSGLTASMTAYNKVALKWKASPSCDGYAIFKREAGGTSRYRGRVNGRTKTSSTDTELPSAGFYLKPGVKYQYYVRAFYEVGGTKYYSDATNICEVTPALEKGTASVRTYKGLYNTVTYKQIPGADGYIIYRRDNGGSWMMRSTRTGNKPVMFKDTYRIRFLNRYRYRVIPYRIIDGVKYMGSYYCSGILIAQPALTTVSKLNRTAKGIQIVWNSQPNCTGYQVYRREGNGGFKWICAITDPKRGSMTDTKVCKGKKYQYCVVAYSRQFYQTNVYGYYKASSCMTW